MAVLTTHHRQAEEYNLLAHSNLLTSKHHQREEMRNIPLHHMPSELHAQLHSSLSNERSQQYREWTWRCNNNRARFLELQTHEHFAQGLLVLSTHLDPAERFHELAHEYRYCRNCAIAELMDFALPIVRPSCANRCDLLERWSDKSQLGAPLTYP